MFSSEGLGQPVYYVYTLNELAVSAIASEVLKSKRPEDYEGWISRIFGGKVPRLVVWLSPVTALPRYDFLDVEARIGRRLLPMSVDVYRIRDFGRKTLIGVQAEMVRIFFLFGKGMSD